MCHREILVQLHLSLCGLKSGTIGCQDCVIRETGASSKWYQASAVFFSQYKTSVEF